MAYVPTTWVDKVTKLGPTNLNHLEQGLQAAAAVADAALPVPAGVNGQFLQRVGGVWVPHTLAAADLAGLVDRAAMAAGNKTTVGTLAAGPPGGPTTNDIWIATDVDANGTVWMFRYNSVEATYKWEFIGGAPIHLQDATGQTYGLNTWAESGPTGNVRFTVARAGDYQVTGLVSGAGSGGGAGTQTFGYGLVSGGSPVAADQVNNQTTTSAAYDVPIEAKLLAVGAAAVITSFGFSNIASATTLKTKTQIIPVRVI